MTKQIAVTFLLLAGVLNSGCTAIFGDTFRDRADDYQQAKTAPEMKQLAGQNLPFKPAMQIPEIVITDAERETFANNKGNSDLPVPRPSPLIEQSEQEEVTSLNAYLSNDLNPRIELDGNGSQVLRIDGQFVIAWAAVSDALSASEYKLTDLNRSTGTYYIEITPEPKEAETGFWHWLWGDDEEVVTSYLLKMNRSRLGVYLSLQTTVDDLAEPEVNLQVLTSLQKALELRGK